MANYPETFGEKLVTYFLFAKGLEKQYSPKQKNNILLALKKSLPSDTQEKISLIAKKQLEQTEQNTLEHQDNINDHNENILNQTKQSTSKNRNTENIHDKNISNQTDNADSKNAIDQFEQLSISEKIKILNDNIDINTKFNLLSALHKLEIKVLGTEYNQIASKLQAQGKTIKPLRILKELYGDMYPIILSQALELEHKGIKLQNSLEVLETIYKEKYLPLVHEIMRDYDLDNKSPTEVYDEKQGPEIVNKAVLLGANKKIFSPATAQKILIESQNFNKLHNTKHLKIGDFQLAQNLVNQYQLQTPQHPPLFIFASKANVEGKIPSNKFTPKNQSIAHTRKIIADENALKAFTLHQPPKPKKKLLTRKPKKELKKQEPGPIPQPPKEQIHSNHKSIVKKGMKATTKTAIAYALGFSTTSGALIWKAFS